MNPTPTHQARTRTSPRIIFLLALACGLVACDQTGVQEEQIAKGIEDIPPATHADESTPPPQNEVVPPESNDSRFPWAVPEGWVHDETPRQMRIATYQATIGERVQEIAVTRFPGRVGGELANINRWRGQLGLEPIGESALDSSIERFAVDGYDGYQIRIESPQGAMLAAAVFDESINQTWFVRATLPDAATADQLEDAVFGMARSIAR